ncbi:MAG: hypothetical protein IKZ41_07705, partial [Clostridia bacterium]|nr:hypothetical protein [Clostridia bacterium]
MKKRGVYYELFTTQAKRYITPIDGVSAEEFMADDENIAKFLDERKEGRPDRRPEGRPEGIPAGLPAGKPGERPMPGRPE